MANNYEVGSNLDTTNLSKLQNLTKKNKKLI